MARMFEMSVVRFVCERGKKRARRRARTGVIRVTRAIGIGWAVSLHERRRRLEECHIALL